MQTLPFFSGEARAKHWMRIGLTAACALLCAGSSNAEVVVTSLGGGSVGTRNGLTTQALFSEPYGLALDAAGNMYVADRNNNRIRKVTAAGDKATSETSTFISTLSKPVDVAIDSDGNLLVLTSGDGRIRKYGIGGATGNLLSTNYPVLTVPLAFALDSVGNIYVTQTNGFLRKINRTNGIPLQNIVTNGFKNPEGVAVLNDGSIAVSDTGNHAIRLVNPTNGVITHLSGSASGFSGYADGTSANARFFRPHKIAKAPNGSLVVADRGNHRVRLITITGTNGIASTLYGISSNLWNASFPGWMDGGTNAHAREPVGVTVANGNVFATEVRWDLLRLVTGGSFSTSTNGGGDGGGGTNVVVIPPPSISPNSGYFPNGQTIQVNSDSGVVYFTTDGSEPTTNSSPVINGVIQWRDSLHDLSVLRVKAFNGTNSSLTTSGQTSPVNEIGIPRDLTAGPGATVVVPVVINLRPNDQLRSVQFIVEVSPLSGAPAISEQFRSLQISSNDFVRVVRPSTTTENLSVSPYSFADVRGLAVAAIGTGANFLVKPFAVVLLVAVPIPAHAQENQSYRIEVRNASGTTNGEQANLSLSLMSPRTITVRSESYLVGDSSPGGWYNAGDFGDGKLFNADVNNAFYASFGIRVPFDFTDAFDAMDVGRPGRPDSRGGDGSITAYDWQRIYRQSIGLDPNNWARTSARDADGIHTDIYQTNGNFTTAASAAKTSKVAKSVTPTPGLIWLRHAVVGAGSTINAAPGSFYSIPVYVKVTPGYSLASLQFRATMLPQGNAPEPAAINFINPIGGNFQQQPGTSPNDIVCSWSMVPSSAFVPQLQGSNLLGHVTFQVPFSAQSGQSYQLKFSHADGLTDFNTLYELENISGYVWVQSAALTPADTVSEQWKKGFFGNTNIQENEDSDNDGFSNSSEYFAGTDPTESSSRLQFSQSAWQENGESKGIILQWLTAPGKIYVVESSAAITAPVWSGLSTNVGNGESYEFIDTNVSNGSQFYRIRLQP